MRKYHVATSAIYFMEFEVEAESREEAEREGQHLAQDAHPSAEEWAANLVVPIAEKSNV